jgi:ornithine cyclodeaminase/alanine dehydrogenase-like protein (mu-crystallin family)
VLLLDSDTLRACLPYEDAVDALADAFVTADLDAVPLRSQVALDGGELLVMPVAAESGVGVKLLTLGDPRETGAPTAIQGVFVLFAPDTLSPVAVLDGGALTALRTAAVSALATRLLARPDARRLVIFGAGAQGRAHLEAMCAVRDLEHVAIVDRNVDRALAIAATAHELGLTAELADARAVLDADIVCTCTTTRTPLFCGTALGPGTHVNAVGSYKLDRRELDSATMGRARVVVEHRPTALAEAGDLALAIADGDLTEARIGELAELLRPGAPDRESDEVTVFKSVGLAFEDLAVAGLALRRSQALGEAAAR